MVSKLWYISLVCINCRNKNTRHAHSAHVLVLHVIINFYFLLESPIILVSVQLSYSVRVVKKFIIPLHNLQVSFMSWCNVDIDGAFFGTTFPHLFLLQFPNYINNKNTTSFAPSIFGFKIHESRYCVLSIFD